MNYRSLKLFTEIVVGTISCLIGLVASANSKGNLLKEVAIILPSAPQTMIPSKAIDEYSLRVIRYVFEPFFYYDDVLGFTSNVFSSWSTSEDGKKYVFRLKPDLYFHNGVKATAADAVFTIKAGIENQQTAIAYVKGIGAIKTNGPASFSISMSESSPFLLRALADRKLSLIPENYAGRKLDEFSKNPIGAGPYQLERASEKEIVLARFKKYVGLNEGQFKRTVATIKFQVTPDLDSFNLAIKGGAIQDPNSMMKISPEDVTNSLVQKGFVKFQHMTLATVFVGVNGASPKLQNNALRSYISDVFRSQEFAEIVGPEKFEPATGFIPQGMIGHNQDSKPLKHVAELKTFAIDKPLNLRFLTYMSGARLSKINAYLKLVSSKNKNLTFEVDAKPMREVVKAVAGKNFDLILLTWGADFGHPLFLVAPFTTNASLNFFGISIPEVDKAIAMFSKMSKRDESETFQKVDKLITDSHLIIPLLYPKTTYFFPKGFSGFRSSMLGIQDFDFSQSLLNNE